MSRAAADDAISLIIPFYNGSAYFDAALQSALAQTLPFAEIIVVNDGSRPDEQAFIEQRAARHGLRLITTANGGQGHARNLGVAAAVSPWVGFLDQDDLLLPGHNRILLTALQKLVTDKAGWAFGSAMVISASGEVISAQGFPHADAPMPTSLADFLARDLHMPPTSTLMSRAAFIAVGGFDRQFQGYEDDDLLIRLFVAGYQGSYAGVTCFACRRHDHQTTHSAVFIRSLARFIDKWHRQVDRRARGALYGRVNNTLSHCYSHDEFKPIRPLLRAIALRQLLRMIQGGHLSLLRQLLRDTLGNRKRLSYLLGAT